MGDRYRYGTRPRSPPLHNPMRASLPINLAYPHEQPHLHVVPSSRREIIPAAPRSSTSSVTNAGTVTTTYKIKADPPARGSSVREVSRSRRSTLDNHNRPSIVTTTPRHRPVVHSSGGIRPVSPIKNPYRSSEEEYVAIPATSRHHHHKKRHSATMDNADMNRLAYERDSSRLRVAPVREPTYQSTRARQIYPSTVVRHADTVSDDYGDDGYGYTNPQDLVRYDLARNEPTTHHRSRRDSFEGGRSNRPTSISGYNDIVPRTYDQPRDRRPPPSTRGFDKIQPAATWDQPQIRMPVPPVVGSIPPMDPVPRPSPFDPIEPPRRTGSVNRARPTSLYHDREPRRGPREEYYEVRDDDRRDRTRRHDSYDDRVEQRGFGIRTEEPDRRGVTRPERPESRTATRPERPESRSALRPERPERPESRSALRADRPERIERDRPERIERDRAERYEKSDRDDERTDRKEHRSRDDDRSDKKEHKGRDALATGLSLAGAALGINAVKNAARSDREDRDERDERRREYEEEPRRRKDRDDKDPDSSGRDTKERRSRDNDASPPARDIPAPAREKEKERSPVDMGARNPRERVQERDNDPDRRDRHRQRSEAALSGNAIDSRSDTSASDEAKPRSHRERPKREPAAASAAAFNPKDTMDLKALKEALNSKDAAAPKVITKEPAKAPRGSSTKDAREVAEIRNDLNADRRGRDPLAPTENRQLRVVSPPREKADEKPVKGILRAPREKFPEDPAPIREGVAPLKDAKKDGIPPDARWTKISRKLVNPEALEAGKERYEAREDFVIVLRVLSRDEVQAYAEITQGIRANREELEEIEAADRRRARRERHERHKREKSGEIPRNERSERRRHRRHHSERSNSESDTTEDDVYDDPEKPKMLEAPKKRATFEETMMSGGLGNTSAVDLNPPMGNLRETAPGQYTGYVRNPPPPQSLSVSSGSGSRRER